MSDNIPLLITGCIAPVKEQPWLKISNASTRLQQYIDSIKFYIDSSNFSHIVFCENSNYSYAQKGELLTYAHNKNKTLEWHSFMGNSDLVRQHGKGIGEDEIYAYAFAHSPSLKEAKTFAKVTGRLKLRNINSLTTKNISKHNYFIRDIYRGKGKKGVDTRFFICNRFFFEQELLNCYQKSSIKENKSQPLEEVYFKLLKGRYKCLKGYPLFDGVSAGNGKEYTKEPKFQLLFFNLLAKIGLFNKFFYFIFLSMRLRFKLQSIIDRIK